MNADAWFVGRALLPDMAELLSRNTWRSISLAGGGCHAYESFDRMLRAKEALGFLGGHLQQEHVWQI